MSLISVDHPGFNLSLTEKTDMRGISFKLQYKEFRLDKEFPENKVPDIEVICK